jgi:hypothetical protein
VRGAAAYAAGVDDANAAPVPRQRHCTGQADRARANHHDVFGTFLHRNIAPYGIAHQIVMNVTDSGFFCSAA